LHSNPASRLSEDLALQRVPLWGFFFACVELLPYPSDLDLVAERDLVQQRHSDAVRALETIRLNLLRLRAGSRSVESLTTDLGRAREVAKEIGFFIEADREIEEGLR
jgi:hypothetical protein